MTDLFPGEPRPLPARKGPTWTASAGDPPPPPAVRHAAGYQPFLALAERYGRPVDVQDHTAIIVEGTVQAILDADEARFAEFQGVVDHWGPGSRGRPVPPPRRFESQSCPPDGD